MEAYVKKIPRGTWVPLFTNCYFFFPCSSFLQPVICRISSWFFFFFLSQLVSQPIGTVKPLFTINGTFLVCDFIRSARDSSSSNLCSPARDSSLPDLRSPERFSDLVLLLLLPIFGSSSSSPSSFIYFSRTWVFKTRIPCDENLSMSAIRTQVFETRFFHRTRASDARDVMFLFFSPVLAN